jgi:outer membrane lipoprotein-sorting protein
MLRNLIITLAGGLLLVNPLSAQEECCDKPAEQVVQASDDAGCADQAESSCDAATVATTVSLDEPSDLAKGLASIADKLFSFDFAVDGKDGDNAFKVKGNISFGDPKHFAVKVAMSGNQGESTQDMKLNLVCDGTFLYYHVVSDDVPAPMNLGKVKVEVLEKLVKMGAAESPFPVFNEKGSLNASTIDKALAESGMKITSDDEKGIVTLSMAAPEGDKGTISIVLDSKTYLPRSISAVEGEAKTINASFTNLKVFKEIKEFGEKAFSFTAPEGASIMDMTGMIEMQLGGMGGGAGEEEELEF